MFAKTCYDIVASYQDHEHFDAAVSDGGELYSATMYALDSRNELFKFISGFRAKRSQF